MSALDLGETELQPGSSVAKEAIFEVLNAAGDPSDTVILDFESKIGGGPWRFSIGRHPDRDVPIDHPTVAEHQVPCGDANTALVFCPCAL